MALLNDWTSQKIIHKDKIIEFEFLTDNNFITEIEDGYFYLNAEFHSVERIYIEKLNSKIMNRLNIQDANKEIKTYIKKLNKYNEAKDIAQSLMGKIADLKGVTIKEIHEEMGVDFKQN